jgi:hypothetical protein
MSTFGYEDFAVGFHLRSARTYDVTARDEAGVEAAGTFSVPFDEAQLSHVIGVLGRSRDVGRDEWSVQELTAQEVGSRLADALLSGAVGELFAGALRRADASGRGLRLRLSLGATPELLDVPWELLYRRPTFLASQRRTPIVRFLDVGEEAQRQRIAGVVRILGVIANPRDLERLDVADERRRLEQALATMLGDGLVELDWLDPATPQELRRTLRDGNYHVLHFIGHGSTRGDESVLVLEDAEGASAPLSRTALVNLFADQRSLCLAVLNSCRGARATLTDPFAGVATSLVALGVSAVVAMQFAISDAAAIAFAEEFYTALISRRMPVDAAVAEGRKAVLTDVNEVEWATPVLFSRSRDGMLFDFRLATGPERVGSISGRHVEAPEPRRRRRRVVTAILAAAVAVGALVVVRLVTGRGDDDDRSSLPTQPVGDAGATGTSLGTDDILPECPTPQGEGWTELEAAGQTAEFGIDPNPQWSYELRGGAARRLDGGGRQLVLDLTASLGPPGGRYIYWWYYELAVGNARFDPTCLSVTGANPIPDGGTSGVLVGFNPSTAEGSSGFLIIDTVEARGRIDLPAT